MRNRLFSLLLVIVAVLAVGAAVQAQEDDQPFLGILFQAGDGGAEVTYVVPGSPAAEAGLERGDLLTAVNGAAVDADTLAETISALSAGDAVTLTVQRDGETLELTATLAAQPERPLLRRMPLPDSRAYIGIALEPSAEGVRIADISADSPAAEAGLQVGDIITAVNGEAVTRPADVALVVRALKAGDTLTLSIERDGTAQDVTVTLGSQVSNLLRQRRGQGFNMPFDRMPLGGRVFLGVQFQTLNADLAAENELDVTEGALVVEVVADSPAAAAGLEAGDVITAVNGDVVDAARTLPERLLAYDPGDTVTLDVLRAGETLSLEATLDSVTPGQWFGMPHDGLHFFFGPDSAAPAEPATTPEPAANL